jgi:DMSO/TMAO reductase YedYZ molybdopterin-dependent catalytic subunit
LRQELAEHVAHGDLLAATQPTVTHEKANIALMRTAASELRLEVVGFGLPFKRVYFLNGWKVSVSGNVARPRLFAVSAMQPVALLAEQLV